MAHINFHINFRINFRIVKQLSWLMAVVCLGAQAEESIEFYAEHLLEVPMDARYLAFPLTPAKATDSPLQVQLGYGHFDAGRMSNQTPMLGASYFYQVSNHWGIMLSGFYDRYQFSGRPGPAKGEVLVVNAPELPGTFAINLTQVSGSGRHQGLGFALAHTPPEGIHWQLGITREQLAIGQFRVDFTSQALAGTGQGYFDYAGNYHIQSLFIGAELKPINLGAHFSARPHLILVHNSPRVGLQGGVYGPDFGYYGDTQSAGNGRHIPDGYMGLGINFTHLGTGISLDLGASLYCYLSEPFGHDGISNPLLLSVSLPLN